MDILQSSSAAPLAPREAANAPAQQAGGSFQGERVHYVSVSQSLADAAEELTFAFSERAEKSLAKRRLSDAHARLSEVQAMLQEYWKRIPDLESQQKLEALIAHLGSGQLSSLAQLSAYLEGFSSEISQRFLALSRARDVLAGRPEARAMLALSLIHISEPTRLRCISYAGFCVKKKNYGNWCEPHLSLIHISEPTRRSRTSYAAF
nr:type III secretion system gatekeeper subunit SctW [Pseudomonas aeruginosa]